MSDIDHASIGALIENFMKAIRQNPNDLPEQQSSPAAHARPFPRTSPTNCDTRLSSSFELNPFSGRIIGPQSHRIWVICHEAIQRLEVCLEVLEHSKQSPWAFPLTSGLVIAIQRLEVQRNLLGPLRLPAGL